jgi:hypothetical protein
MINKYSATSVKRIEFMVKGEVLRAK